MLVYISLHCSELSEVTTWCGAWFAGYETFVLYTIRINLMIISLFNVYTIISTQVLCNTGCSIMDVRVSMNHWIICWQVCRALVERYLSTAKWSILHVDLLFWWIASRPQLTTLEELSKKIVVCLATPYVAKVSDEFDYRKSHNHR